MNMKDLRFGIEIEMTGLTRKQAAEVTAAYFGTSSRYLAGYYQTYAAIDNQDRQWKFMSDSSIVAQIKTESGKIAANDNYKTEMVSPICCYEDIITIQDIIRKLKEAGAITNKSCGIHIHIDASAFDAQKLRNLTNIMAAKEDLIYKALGVSVERQHRWCRPVEQRFLDELNRARPRIMESVERIWYNGDSRRYEHYDNSRYHCLNLHSVFQKGTVEFRLFNGTLHAGKIKAYIQFCLAIAAQALNQSCASRKKTQTTNEKYTFRTWLLRLGLNGDEFKTARTHLLANLDGCIAWKDPAQAQAQKERLRKKKEQGQAERTEQPERTERQAERMEQQEERVEQQMERAEQQIEGIEQQTGRTEQARQEERQSASALIADPAEQLRIENNNSGARQITCFEQMTEASDESIEQAEAYEEEASAFMMQM